MYTIRIAEALLVEYRFYIPVRMLPHLEYVRFEQFDAILATTNSTVYEHAAALFLIVTALQKNRQHTQAKDRVTLSMSYACQHTSRNPARI